jgi:hypothetical protein
MRQLEDVARTRSLGRQGTWTSTVKKHLLIVIAVAAVMVALWMTGLLHEAPPLISN